MTMRFWEDGYDVVPAMLDTELLKMLRAGIETSERTGRMHVAKVKAQQGSQNQYKPLLGEMTLRKVQPLLEGLIGRPLAPTYSFWRIYEQGMALKPHRDRPACEISLSVPIHCEPEGANWPLRLTDLSGRDHAPAMVPGDGLLYQGCAVEHWREPLTEGRQYQMFLHYVLADGENAALAGDRRPG